MERAGAGSVDTQHDSPAEQGEETGAPLKSPEKGGTQSCNEQQTYGRR